MRFTKNQIQAILNLDTNHPAVYYFTRDESQIVTHTRLVKEIENIILIETKSTLLDLAGQLNIDLSVVDLIVSGMV
jgi:hypothetical protein